MNRVELIRRVRSLTRDITNSVFREQDIIDFLNEGIDRFVQSMIEFESMEYLNSQSAIPYLIPRQYQHLLSVYATARCFGQDEQLNQATTFMNEFEFKLGELKEKIESGLITIVDLEGNPVEDKYIEDAVTDVYFNHRVIDEG